jgi:hypothetical protein
MYMGFYIIGSLVSSIILIKKTPELFKSERKNARRYKDMDKIIILTYFLFAIIITPLVAGLDSRFEISSLPFYLRILE